MNRSLSSNLCKKNRKKWRHYMYKIYIIQFDCFSYIYEYGLWKIITILCECKINFFTTSCDKIYEIINIWFSLCHSDRRALCMRVWGYSLVRWQYFRVYTRVIPLSTRTDDFSAETLLKCWNIRRNLQTLLDLVPFNNAIIGRKPVILVSKESHFNIGC